MDKKDLLKELIEKIKKIPGGFKTNLLTEKWDGAGVIYDPDDDPPKGDPVTPGGTPTGIDPDGCPCGDGTFHWKCCLTGPGTYLDAEKDEEKYSEYALISMNYFWIEDGVCETEIVQDAYLCPSGNTDQLVEYDIDIGGGNSIPAGTLLCSPCTANTFQCFKDWVLSWQLFGISFMGNYVDTGMGGTGGYYSQNQDTWTGIHENCYGCAPGYFNNSAGTNEYPTPTSGDNLNLANVNDGSCVFEYCYNNYNTNSNHFCQEYPDLCDGASIYSTLGQVTDSGCTVEGCMDPAYQEYDPAAEIDTDPTSCINLTGCTDPTAFNYNSEADVDDGSCIPTITGCTDPTYLEAFNYNSTLMSVTNLPEWQDGVDEPFSGWAPNTSDASACITPIVEGCGDITVDDENNIDVMLNVDCLAYDSFGTCTDIQTVNINVQTSCVTAIPGCMDSAACAQTANANLSDNTMCDYETCYGCTTPGMSGYSPDYTIDDGSCTYTGCLDSEQFNGEYIYANYVCEVYPYMCGSVDSDGDGTVDVQLPLSQANIDAYSDDLAGEVALGTFTNSQADCSENIIGCMDDDYIEYNPNASIEDASMCVTLIQEGCMDINAQDPWGSGYNAGNNVSDPGDCTFEVCTDDTAFNYVCLPPPVYLDLVPNDTPDLTYLCDSDGPQTDVYNIEDWDGCIYEIPGCTDTTAYNYNSQATVNDGSCIPYIYGCDEDFAINFYCLEQYEIPDYPCDANDFPPDNFIPYDDASYTGTEECIGPVEGCTDSNAINYNNDANTDDGSCYYCYDVVVEQCAPEIPPQYLTQITIPCITIGGNVNVTPGMSFICDDPSICPNQWLDDDGDGVPDWDEVSGCTDTNACNYDPSATDTDNSGCTYPNECGSCSGDMSCFGCLDENALNYCSSCTEDSGYCEYYEPTCIWCPGFHMHIGIDGTVLTPGDQVQYGYWYIQSPSMMGNQGFMSSNENSTGYVDEPHPDPEAQEAIEDGYNSGLHTHYWTGTGGPIPYPEVEENFPTQNAGGVGLNKDYVQPWWEGQGASMRCQLTPWGHWWGEGNGPMASGPWRALIQPMQDYCSGLMGSSTGFPEFSNGVAYDGQYSEVGSGEVVNGCSVCPSFTEMIPWLDDIRDEVGKKVFKDTNTNAGRVTCKHEESECVDFLGPDFCCGAGTTSTPIGTDFTGTDSVQGASYSSYGMGNWGCPLGQNISFGTSTCDLPEMGGYPCPVDEQPYCCRHYTKYKWVVNSSGNNFTETNTLVGPHSDWVTTGSPQANDYIDQCT